MKKLSDFVEVFRHPRDILLGCAAQFTIMPLLAFALGKVFGLPAGLLAGVILVGTAFPNLAMATVPGAIFSVWHNISGAMIANLFRRMKSEE